MKVVVGQSEFMDAKDAVLDAIKQCKSKLGKEKPKMAVVFATDFYDHKLILEEVNKAFPGILVVGTSSVGEMSSVVGYTEGSVVIAIFCSDKVEMHGVLIKNVNRDTFQKNFDEAIATLPKGVLEKSVCCFTLPETMQMSIDMIFNQLKKMRGPNYPIFGGGASDKWKFTTLQFFNNEVLRDAATMVFFTGPLEISFGAASGWEPFSPQKKLAKTDVNVAIEIGELKSLDFYEHYLKSRKPTMAHPLAVYEEGEENFYLRCPMKENEVDSTIAFCCPMPSKDSSVSIASTTPEKILEATKLSVDRALETAPKNVDASFIVSCICRQEILGTRTEEECKIIKEALGEDVPFFGFYGFAQLGPHMKNEPAFVHEETFITVLLGEVDE